MAKKYIVRNGVKIPEEKALEAAKLRVRGYTYSAIAKMLDLSEHEIVSLLTVNRE